MTLQYVIFDLEANGFLDKATNVWCGVFKDVKTGKVWKFDKDQIPEMLDFMSTCANLIAHNGFNYDLPLLEKLYGYKYRGNVIDTVIMSRTMYESPFVSPAWPRYLHTRPHSLEAWGYRLGRGKPDHSDWENYSPEMLHRCTEDVEITYLLFKKLCDESKKNNWSAANATNQKLFKILEMQQDYGWLVDRKHMDTCCSLLRHWISRIDRLVAPVMPMVIVIEEGTNPVKDREEKGHYKYVREPFTKAGKPKASLAKWYSERGIDPGFIDEQVYGPFSRISFRRVDPAKADECKNFLLESGWIPDAWNISKVTGEKTSPKMSYKDNFIGVDGMAGKLISKRVQCSHRLSTIEGYIKRIRPDGRLPSRITGIASTGRLKHGVIVNVPNVESFFGKMMRRIFTTPVDKRLITCDADSCQNRLLAARADAPDFTAMLLNGDKAKGTDSHSLTQKAINRVLSRHNKPTITRGSAKNVGFGWKFGASTTKIGAMVGGSKQLGEEIKESLEEEFEAQAAVTKELTAEWRKHAKKRVNQWGNIEYYDGWFTGLDGRPITVKSEHAILVFALQSDESIVMTNAYVLAYQAMIKSGLVWGKDFAIVNFMHDEISVEASPQHVEVVTKILEESINKAGQLFNLTVPQIGEADVGNNWSETH